MKKNKIKVDKVRFEPKTIGGEDVAHNHYRLHYTIHAVWLPFDPFIWIVSGQAYP